MEDVCAEAYQFAGEVGAPVRVLDRLWAAGQGQAIPAKSMLPITADECSEVSNARRALNDVLDVLAPYLRRRLAARAGASASEQKATASRANGRKGGRPCKAV